MLWEGTAAPDVQNPSTQRRRRRARGLPPTGRLSARRWLEVPAPAEASRLLHRPSRGRSLQPRDEPTSRDGRGAVRRAVVCRRGLPTELRNGHVGRPAPARSRAPALATAGCRGVQPDPTAWTPMPSAARPAPRPRRRGHRRERLDMGERKKRRRRGPRAASGNTNGPVSDFFATLGANHYRGDLSNPNTEVPLDGRGSTTQGARVKTC